MATTWGAVHHLESLVLVKPCTGEDQHQRRAATKQSVHSVDEASWVEASWRLALEPSAARSKLLTPTRFLRPSAREVLGVTEGGEPSCERGFPGSLLSTNRGSG